MSRHGQRLRPAPEVLLRVENLSKRFCLHLLGRLSVEALGGLSFQLREGDFGVLRGPSGAGKSTVLKCIYGTYLPSAGIVSYRRADGTRIDLARCPEQEILRLRRQEIGYVSQFLRCAPRIPAEAIVAAPRMGMGDPAPDALNTARSLLRRLGVPERLWRAYPASFSGGEQQRVNLARALILRPRLLLLDEPTASLDAGATEHFLEVLDGARIGGTTCLGVFHDSKMIHRLATRIIEVRPPGLGDEGRATLLPEGADPSHTQIPRARKESWR